MNEEQQQRFEDKGQTTGGTVSTRLPLVFRFIHGGKTQRSAINHQSVLTRMIFVSHFCFVQLLILVSFLFLLIHGLYTNSVCVLCTGSKFIHFTFAPCCNVNCCTTIRFCETRTSDKIDKSNRVPF